MNIFECENKEQIKIEMYKRRQEQRATNVLEALILGKWFEVKPDPLRPANQPFLIRLTGETKDYYTYDKLDRNDQIIGTGATLKKNLEMTQQ